MLSLHGLKKSFQGSSVIVDETYVEWLRAHRDSLIAYCCELALSDSVLDEIDDVFRRAYEHPACFDFDRLQGVIAYGIREATGFSPRDLMG